MFEELILESTLGLLVGMKEKLNIKTCIFHKFLKPINKLVDIETFFTLSLKKTHKYISRSIKTKGCIKTLLTLKVIMQKRTVDNDYIFEEIFFQSGFHQFGQQFEIRQSIQQMFEKILSSFECFIKNGSGWTLHNICHLEIRNILCKKIMSGR